MGQKNVKFEKDGACEKACIAPRLPEREAEKEQKEEETTIDNEPRVVIETSSLFPTKRPDTWLNIPVTVAKRSINRNRRWEELLKEGRVTNDTPLDEALKQLRNKYYYETQGKKVQCECGKIVTTQYLQKHKACKQHTEAMKMLTSDHIENNKVQCECGAIITRNHLNHHVQSKQHNERINANRYVYKS